jgi:hypothetical protein
MSARALSGRVAAVLLAFAAGSCGRYAELAQKLDVTGRFVGDTWITAVDPSGGTDRTQVRLLLVGKPDANGVAPFAFSAVNVTHSRGDSVYTLEGSWVEPPPPGTTTLDVAHEYTMPDESTTPILNRVGTQRSDDRFQISLTVARSAGRLAVSGDARLTGTYVLLTEALANLSTATQADAACAFQVANLPMLRSQGRIIGFGGPQLLQYTQPASYVGTFAGSMVIRFSGSLSKNHTQMDYGGFVDVGGVVVDGPMITDANSSGNGAMSGVMRFEFDPVAPDGTPLTAIKGTIDYGANAIQIVSGNADGGFYTVALDAGGPTALVPPETAPSPSVAVCLALP